MKIGLRTKLIIIIESVVVVVALAAGIFSFIAIRRVFEERIFAQLQSVTVLKENRIKSFLSGITMEIEYIAGPKAINSQLVRFLEDEGKGKKEIVEYLKGLEEGKAMFVDLFILNPNGEVVLSSNESEEGKIMTDETFINKTKTKTYFQNFGDGAFLGKAALMVGTPILNKEGVFVGVLAGRVNIDDLNKLMMERSGLGETGESAIINKNNLAITDLLKEPGSALKRSIMTPQVIKCLTGATLSQKVTDYHGDQAYGYYSWLPEIESCVASKVDVAEVFTSVQTTYFYMLAIVVGVGLLVGVVGIILGNILFRPLQSLLKVVSLVNEGNLDVKVKVDTNDETGELANAFNEMAGKLKLSYSNLEEKVNEKTNTLEEKLAELEKMNNLMVGRELKMIELKEQLRNKENDEAKTK